MKKVEKSTFSKFEALAMEEMGLCEISRIKRKKSYAGSGYTSKAFKRFAKETEVNHRLYDDRNVVFRGSYEKEDHNSKLRIKNTRLLVLRNEGSFIDQRGGGFEFELELDEVDVINIIQKCFDKNYGTFPNRMLELLDLGIQFESEIDTIHKIRSKALDDLERKYGEDSKVKINTEHEEYDELFNKYEKIHINETNKVKAFLDTYQKHLINEEKEKIKQRLVKAVVFEDVEEDIDDSNVYELETDKE